MDYDVKIPRMGVGQKSRKIEEAMTAGFKMAMLCGAGVLADGFDFDDKALEWWLNESNYLLSCVATGREPIKNVISNLEERTGIKLNFER